MKLVKDQVVVRVQVSSLNQVRNQICVLVRDQTWVQIRKSIWEQIWVRVWEQIWK